MKQLKRIRRHTFPKFEVIKAKQGIGGIRVKINMPMSGTQVSSPWMKMDMNYYWKNGKQFRVKKIIGDPNNHLLGSFVRILELEKEHRISIRKQQNNMYRRNKY